MGQIIKEEVLKEEYLGHNITGNHIKYEDLTSEIFWTINGPLLNIKDIRTIDGEKLQSVRHCINDAKANLDAVMRLDDIKKQIEVIKLATEKASKNKETAIQFLEDAGILKLIKE